MGLSCHDIQATQGARKSGVYLIHPPNLAQGPWRVYCDLESEGGGWIVFQVRDDVEPKENFMRGWEDYKVGFGDFDREFWLGEVQGHGGSACHQSACDGPVSTYKITPLSFYLTANLIQSHSSFAASEMCCFRRSPFRAP